MRSAFLARKSIGERIFEILNVTILIALGIAMFYPFWHELCLSLSSSTEATRGGVFFYPREFTVEAYTQVLESSFIWVAFKNSILSTIAVTVIGGLFTAMLAYGLSKKQIVGSKTLSFIVIFCMIFNGGLIPTYLTINNFGLVDSLWALILLAAVTPYNTIIMKNFFSSLPAELEEAAFIDGANPMKIFFTIILPLSKAVLATVGLWLAVANWNNFMGGLIYLHSRENFTLPIYIRQVIDGQILARETGEGAETAVESIVGATIMVSVFPILCVYPFLQKYFVKGVMIGSVKG